MDHSGSRAMLMEFLRMLDEPCKLYCRNKKLLLSFLLFPLLTSFVYVSGNFYEGTFLIEMLAKASVLSITTPSIPGLSTLGFGILRDVRFLSIVELACMILDSLTSLFVSTAVIHASALSSCERSISFKGLFLVTMKSCKRALVTYLHISLFVLGCTFLLSSTLYPADPFSLFLAILATALQPYLAVVWSLALVVSILEESYGIEALGRAAKMVKGVRLQASLLNYLCAVLYWFLWLGIRLIDTRIPSLQTVVGQLSVGSISILNIFLLMAYTVIYFRCKKMHGEDVELVGSLEYGRLPDDPLVNKEDIP